MDDTAPVASRERRDFGSQDSRLGRPATPASEELTLLEFLVAVLTRWRAVVAFTALATGCGLAVSVLLPPTFKATTTFFPEPRLQGPLPPGLAGLAGQFGITLGSDASQSPRFYGKVLKTRELMEHVLVSRYAQPSPGTSPGDSTTLLRVLKVDGKDLRDSLEKGVKKLSRLTAVTVDNQTGIVELSVTARYPELAAAIANRFLQHLNEFNTKTRQFQARELRKFIEDRVADGERQLRMAEEELRSFYERNRSWQQSPQLVFEEGRLRRQVEIRQEVYLTLRREYETARIEEVNDTPVITVIDSAVPPKKKSRAGPALFIPVAFAFGGMIGVLWAVGAHYLDRTRKENPEQYRELVGLWTGIGRHRPETAA